METGIDVGGVDLGTAISLLAGAVAVVVAMTVVLAIIKSFLYICRPNEILIFAGRRHTLPDGSSVGYKVVRSGWAVRTLPAVCPVPNPAPKTATTSRCGRSRERTRRVKTACAT